jgi:acetyl-CoA C-acetyltransferase
MKAHNSVTSGKINNIVSVAGVTKDGIIRGSTTTAKLSELLPVFDRSGTGTLTAGNSSALTDGASLVHLVSEKMASNNPQCTALAYIDDIEFAAVPPSDGLLMAPTLALPRLLARNNLTLDDIDYFEIHEAFAAQVLCTLKAWQDGWAKYPSCQLGQIDPAKINVRGGSLAYGHPFAATGARLVFNLAQLLAESPNNNSRGIISVCAAGGMGACVLMSKA